MDNIDTLCFAPGRQALWSMCLLNRYSDPDMATTIRDHAAHHTIAIPTGFRKPEALQRILEVASLRRAGASHGVEAITGSLFRIFAGQRRGPVVIFEAGQGYL